MTGAAALRVAVILVFACTATGGVFGGGMEGFGLGVGGGEVRRECVGFESGSEGSGGGAERDELLLANQSEQIEIFLIGELEGFTGHMGGGESSGRSSM